MTLAVATFDSPSGLTVPTYEIESPVKRLALRLLALLGLFLALLYPLYLWAGNHFLRSGELEKRLNRRPERLLIRFRSARTVFPGVVQFEGLEIRNQTRTVQWWVAVERGSADIDLPRLYRREFIVSRLVGEGVVFRLRRRADTPYQKTVTRRALEPPIPGFSNPPRPAPEGVYPPGPRKPRSGVPKRPTPPWRIRLAGIDLSGVREIWIEEVRFSGEARAAGAFDLRLRRRFELEGARLEVVSGNLALGAGKAGEPILGGIHGRVAGNIASYRPADFGGWNMLRFVSGRAEIEGRMRGLDWLNLYLQPVHWVDLRGAAGPMTADLRMKEGEFIAGTHMEARPDHLALGFLDYLAEGAGRVRWELNPGEGGSPQAVGGLSLTLDEFRLRRGRQGKPHVQGRDLRLDAGGSEPPQLAKHVLFTPKWVSIAMPQAEVPDLSYYNAYLPKTAPFGLIGGSGRISGSFRAAAPIWEGTGDLHLQGRGVTARFEDRRLRGDLAVHTLLRKVDFQERRFDISGTQVELSGVRRLGSSGSGGAALPWWARARLQDAVVQPGAPVYLRAGINSTLSDPRPLLAMFIPEQRKRVLRWVDNLLDVKGVAATGQVRLAQSGAQLNDMKIAGGSALLLGDLRFGPGRPNGALYARYGRLDVGLDLQDGQRDWKILRPKKWFEEQRGGR
jgi:hypothetical protein